MKKELALNISVAVIVTVTALSFLEIAQRVRYVLRYGTSYWMQYGFVTKPGDEASFKMQLAGSFKVRQGDIVRIPRIFYDGYSKFDPAYPHAGFSVNALGFRGAAFDPKKREGVFRIEVIGDSTVFGLGVPDDRTFPSFLQRDLTSACPGAAIEVLNLGIPSFTTGNMKALVRNEALSYGPDLIIVYGFFNDIYYSPVVFRKDAYALTYVSSWLADHSVFYMSLREKLAKAMGRDIGMLYRGSIDSLVKNLSADTSIVSSISGNVEEIVSAAGGRSVPVVIVSQAVRLTPTDARNGILESDRLKDFYARVYESLGGAAAKSGARIVWANRYFDSLPDGASKFTDGVHLTAGGNELLAAYICDAIKDTVRDRVQR